MQSHATYYPLSRVTEYLLHSLGRRTRRPWLPFMTVLGVIFLLWTCALPLTWEQWWHLDMVDSEARHDSKPWGNLLDVASLLAAKWTVMASSNPLGRVWFLLALSDAGWLPLDQRAPLGVYLWELPLCLQRDDLLHSGSFLSVTAAASWSLVSHHSSFTATIVSRTAGALMV